MKFRHLAIFIVFFTLTFSIFGCKKNSTEPGDTTNTPVDSTGWTLVWADEFNYNGFPDATKWRYETGGSGWGNNELQYYTANRKENAYVYDTALVITARKEDFNGKKFTSVRLNSKANPLFKYGRFEVRAILPWGTGTWPAIWMLADVWDYGNQGWPDNGEIDIMEHVGYDYGKIHASVHTKTYNHRLGTQKTAITAVNDCSAVYHVYAIEWDSVKMDFFVDNKKYLTFKNEGTGFAEWPFDKAFHFIFNIAVGGDWGGAQGVDSTVYPQKMYIDYARVYKKVN